MKVSQLAWMILLPLLLNTAAAQQSALTVSTNSMATNNPAIQHGPGELFQKKTNFPPNEITTRDGTTYRGVTVQKVDPDGLVIEYMPAGGGIGVAKLKYENLPDDLQNQYRYNPDKAAAYEAQQARGMAEWRAHQQADAETAKLNAIQRADQDALEQQEQKAQTEIEESQKHIQEIQTATTVSAPFIDVGGGHWIEKVLDDGSIIKLEDNSLWQVDPLDKIDSALWLPLDNITVIEGDDPTYPYKLVNTDDNHLVDVKPIQ